MWSKNLKHLILNWTFTYCGPLSKNLNTWFEALVAEKNPIYRLRGRPFDILGEGQVDLFLIGYLFL